MNEDSTKKSQLLFSMVALNSPSLPAPQEMLKTLAALSGDAVKAGAVESREGALTFLWNGNIAAVALTPAPIPWSQLDGPCDTAWWWPEAAARMRGHNSHLLLVVGGEEGDVLRRSIALTQFTAAVAVHVDAAGIYWNGGRLVHEPHVFLEETRRASRKNLPLHLWVDLRVEANDDGTLRLFTTGMKALDKMEIEIPHSRHKAKELFDFAYAIADYLLSRGAEIRDGHTVGRGEDEKVIAAHAPSMWDDKMTVLRLDY